MQEARMDSKTLEYLAELSRLQLSESEKESFARELSAALAGLDKILDIDTDNTQPLTHPLPMENVLREDRVQPSQNREQLLENAPRHKDGCFAVPKTVG